MWHIFSGGLILIKDNPKLSELRDILSESWDSITLILFHLFHSSYCGNISAFFLQRISTKHEGHAFA